jgi:hypothetical protein
VPEFLGIDSDVEVAGRVEVREQVDAVENARDELSQEDPRGDADLAAQRPRDRQRNSRLGLIPWRRATAEMFAQLPDASATIAAFFAADQRRRVSATTA